MMDQGNTAVLEDTETRLSPRWQILLHNDAVTPADFVVFFLLEVLKKSEEDATTLMTEAHEKGAAVIFVGSKEVCEFRYEQGVAFIERYRMDLKISMESIEG
jgi:ATP-dependent Clp protease adaptor protein ClpS